MQVRNDGVIKSLSLMVLPGTSKNPTIAPPERWMKLETTINDKLTREQLLSLAYYDTLTKLPNRTLFFDRLQQSILRAERSNTLLAILFLDLDDFKAVNDSFGHDFGDLLLCEVAKRAQNTVRSGDTIARFGGDEFVVILEDIQSVATAAKMAKRLITTLSDPISINHHQMYISVSIGISTYPSDGGIAKNLLKKADIAMYKAKESGKNQFKYYEKYTNENQARSLKLMSDLSHALEYNELFLVYQPQYSLESKQFTGAEVLIRWQHPDLGLISPAEFIPLAEMNGMINPITERIFMEVSNKFKQLEQHGHSAFTLSVNISPRMLFESEFIPTLSFLLDNYYLPSEKLRLEITENTFIKNMSELVDKLQQLKDFGLHLEIDDYGTGFTSLNYLINLPIDTLKIDRCFITDIDKIPKNRAIVSAMITIAHHLEMQIIAEGAETESEKSVLEELECDTIQGYYYSKPLPFDALLLVNSPLSG